MLTLAHCSTLQSFIAFNSFYNVLWPIEHANRLNVIVEFVNLSSAQDAPDRVPERLNS